ncbi:MAG TPA: sialidase family protein [Anaerolineales bacterium]|nr:sialidase family protein [Anaerolineales bacterium]
MKLIRISRILGILVILGLLATVASAQGHPPLPPRPGVDTTPQRVGMELSGYYESTISLVSKLGGMDPQAGGVVGLTPFSSLDADDAWHGRRDILVNQDFNNRAQNETAIAVDPHDPRHIVTGYNDYRAGWPIGGGFSTSFDRGRTWHDGLVTFPALIAPADFPGFAEPPVGTGDPAVAFANDGTVYHSSLGFSASFCEGGVFVYRSDNGGVAWWRPQVALGLGVVDYWPYAFDCSVILDKEYMTVDNSGGLHDGRVYVTYTRFFFEGGADYFESPIYLSYSDDKGETWTVVGEINGASADLCEFQVDTTGGTGPGASGADATPYDCDENQFSYPVVSSDGSLYVHFLNEQNESDWTAAGNFNDQIMVVKVDPDTFAVSGPYQVANLYDGLNNYPISPVNGRQTVCNGGWRLNAAGNLAIGPQDELYVTWADNRNGDEFPFPTLLNPDGSCPGGLQTSTDVFISKSTDGGVTWSAAKKISKDPPNFDNWFPWVAVGQNGLVAVVYFDRRASGDNTLTDAWVATSWGGNGWKELRVSDTSSDFSTAFFGTPSFIGDYNGLAIADLRLYPFWTDARLAGDSDVFIDIVRPSDD